MKILQRFALAMLAMASICVFSGRSEAAFEVQITVGSNPTIFVADNGSGDVVPVSDSITTIQTVNLSVGLVLLEINAKMLNPGGNPSMSVTSTLRFLGALGIAPTINIQTSYTDLNSPPSNKDIENNINGGATPVAGPNGTFTFQGWASTANTLYSQTGLTTAPLGAPGSNFNTGAVNNPYSISTSITFSSLNVTSADQQFGVQSNTNLTPAVTVVPAPPALLLGLMGLPILSLARRYRRKTETQAAA